MNQPVTPEIPPIEERFVTINCPAHGEVESREWRIWANSQWNKDGCEQCRITQKLADEEERDYLEQKRREKALADSLQLRLRQSEIPERFAGQRLADLTPTSEAEAACVQLLEQFVRNWPWRRKDGTCLILLGNVGTGKTSRACQVATEIMQQGATARYTALLRACRAIKATFAKGSKLTEEEVYARYIEPDLLIIDEVGVQWGSAAEQQIAYEIINGRYEQEKNTIVISNHDRDELEGLLGERVIDRLRENGGKVLAFDWNSYRGGGK